MGFLACALLVINNLRDIPTDTASGKRTLAVRLGDRSTRHLYALMVIGAFFAASAAALVRPWALLALVGLAVAQAPISGCTTE